MPELLTRRLTPWDPARWPVIVRWGGRLQIGMVADIKSEYPAGFRRNLHPDDLLFRETTALHALVLALTRANFKLG